jgi:hypothetical protein
MHFRSGIIRKDDGPSPASTECGDGSDKAPTGGASKSRLRKARMKLRQLLTRRMDTTEFDDRIGLDAANSEV